MSRKRCEHRDIVAAQRQEITSCSAVEVGEVRPTSYGSRSSTHRVMQRVAISAMPGGGLLRVRENQAIVEEWDKQKTELKTRIHELEKEGAMPQTAAAVAVRGPGGHRQARGKHRKADDSWRTSEKRSSNVRGCKGNQLETRSSAQTSPAQQREHGAERGARKVSALSSSRREGGFKSQGRIRSRGQKCERHSERTKSSASIGQV